MMIVSEVMTRGPITVRPDEPFDRLVELLLNHDISALPVVDEREHLLGLVSEADLVSRAAYGPQRRRPLQLVAEYLMGRDPQWLRKAAATTAGELMTTSHSTVVPGDNVANAARLMLTEKIRHVVVVDNAQRVLGIVSRRDLLPALANAATT